jgi:hypothetical protein
MSMQSHAKQVICATLLTGVYDVNRNEALAEDQFSLIKEWYHSIIDLQLHGIIFHNSFSDETVAQYQNQYIKFIKVSYDGSINPNAYRYLIYNDFLRANEGKIEQLFVTDIADVVVLQNPFIQPLFIQNPDLLFCGDEQETLANPWMQQHNSHLRNHITSFAEYESANQNKTLLNCGIIGGHFELMQSLMQQLSQIHNTYTIHNKTAFTLDMGAFNFIARTQFGENLKHGTPINTIFKQYEKNRSDCWFRHK